MMRKPDTAPNPILVHADAEDRAQALARLAGESLLAAQMAAEMRRLAAEQQDPLDTIEHAAQRTRASAHAGRREVVSAAGSRAHGLALAGAVTGALALGPATLLLAGVKLAAGAALGGALAGALVGNRVNKALSRANARAGAHVREAPRRRGRGRGAGVGVAGGPRYLHVSEGLGAEHSANAGRDGLLWSDCLGEGDGGAGAEEEEDGSDVDGEGHGEDPEAEYLESLTGAPRRGERRVGAGAAKTSSAIKSGLMRQQNKRR
jgi:hypothetical protein